jgi:hypothetical protein
MRRQLLVVAAAVCACLAMDVPARAETITLSGTISDSLCGASHKAMAEKQGSKISDRDCVIACLNYSTENSPKLVVVEKSGKVYQIANQKFPGLIRRAGEPLKITGDVSGTTVTITSVEAVK